MPKDHAEGSGSQYTGSPLAGLDRFMCSTSNTIHHHTARPYISARAPHRCAEQIRGWRELARRLVVPVFLSKMFFISTQGRNPRFPRWLLKLPRPVAAVTMARLARASKNVARCNVEVRHCLSILTPINWPSHNHLTTLRSLT